MRGSARYASVPHGILFVDKVTCAVYAADDGRLYQVEVAPSFATSNPDTASAAAFKLTHSRPGTLSLALSVDDGEEVSPTAPMTRFRITTGPGPVPRLDGKDIVIGRVLSGLATVDAIRQVPTYAPTSTGRWYNQIARAIGDSRAATARGAWTRPRQAIVITDCGVLGADD